MPSGTKVKSPKMPPTGNRKVTALGGLGSSANAASPDATEKIIARACCRRSLRSRTSQTHSAPSQGRAMISATKSEVLVMLDIDVSSLQVSERLYVQRTQVTPDLYYKGQRHNGDDSVGHNGRHRQRLSMVGMAIGVAGQDDSDERSLTENLQRHHNFDQVTADEQTIESNTQ